MLCGKVVVISEESYLYTHTDWNPYAVWVAALSVTTFIIYGLDKLTSKIYAARTPEKLLHLLLTHRPRGKSLCVPGP